MRRFVSITPLSPVRARELFAPRRAACRASSRADLTPCCGCFTPGSGGRMSSPFRLHRAAFAQLLICCCREPSPAATGFDILVSERWHCERVAVLTLPAVHTNEACSRGAQVASTIGACGIFSGRPFWLGPSNAQVLTQRSAASGGPFLIKLRIQPGCGVSASVAGGDPGRDGAGAKLLRAKRSGQGQRPRRPGCRGRRSRSQRVLPSTPVRAPEIARRRYRLPHTPESGCPRPRTPAR